MLEKSTDQFIFSRLEDLGETEKAKETYRKLLTKFKEDYTHAEVLEIEELLNLCVSEAEYQAYKKGLQDGISIKTIEKEPAATQGN